MRLPSILISIIALPLWLLNVVPTNAITKDRNSSDRGSNTRTDTRPIPVDTNNSRKRYNLALPDELFNEVKSIAESRHTSVLEVLRQFIKLGLLAVKIAETPDSALIIRERGVEKQIVIL